MADDIVSVDEFLASRKNFVKSGDVLMKANRAASSWNPDSRTIRFTMSAEVEDRDRDIVMQAGLLTEEFMKNPQAFYNHNARGFPVGKWIDVQKVLNGRPKRTEGTLELMKEGLDEVADRLAVHLGAGTIRACSIGFIPKKVKRREKPQGVKEEDYYWPGYLIEEAELVECSPCTIPSNPAALAKMAADGDVMASEIIAEILDTWTQHPETGLIVPRAEFERAHKDAHGNRTQIVINIPETAEAATVSKLLSDALAKAVQGEVIPTDRKPTGHRIDSADGDGSAITSLKTPEGEDGEDDEPGPYEKGVSLTEPEKISLLSRIFKLFGSNANERVEQELREKRRREAEEAVALAARKEALEHRFQNLETRLGAKGLVD